MTPRNLTANRLRLIAGSAAMIALGGCTSFGGNVRGSFSCTAPDGVCAPSASIDDRALAMIAGEAGTGDVVPVGPYQSPPAKARPVRTATGGQRVPIDRVDPRRTQDHVLRIVFQPYIDEQGRLHEASAIHTVVQTAAWRQQVVAAATAIPDRNAPATAPDQVSLADVVDRASSGFVDVSAIDPNLPDPAVVAAARARASDPVEAIKNDVAARLAPKAGRTPSQRPSPAATGQKKGEGAPTSSGSATAPLVKPAAIIAEKKPATGSTPAAALPVVKTTVGAEAVARVKASPDYQARAAEAEKTARQAAGNNASPDVPPAQTATVRPAGFPASVPEEN